MNFAYYHDLWLIGPTDERRRAERWAMSSGALTQDNAWWRAVFHPTLGHEVATTLCFDTPNRSFHSEAHELARRFPSLHVMLAVADEDGDSAGWVIHHGDQPLNEVPFHHPSNDADEVMHAQRRDWFPRVKTLYEAVPFPDGSDLEQAGWRDDGDAVARLLTSPSCRPDHPELWWAGLMGAVRRQATWIDPELNPDRYLHGRNAGWSRSAVDAWMAAFPKDLRELARLAEPWTLADVSAQAALMHWDNPASIYAPCPLIRSEDLIAPFPMARHTSGTSDASPHDHRWLRSPLRWLRLPLNLMDQPPADRAGHLQILTAMRPIEREHLLNDWLRQVFISPVSDPDHEAQTVRTIELLNQHGWQPTAWTDPATLAHLATLDHPQVLARLEADALHAAVIPGTGSPTPRGRTRL